jgi:hypothetical protein
MSSSNKWRNKAIGTLYLSVKLALSPVWKLHYRRMNSRHKDPGAPASGDPNTHGPAVAGANRHGTGTKGIQFVLTPHTAACFFLPLTNLTGRGASLQVDSDSTNPLVAFLLPLPPLKSHEQPSLPPQPANRLPAAAPPRLLRASSMAAAHRVSAVIFDLDGTLLDTGTLGSVHSRGAPSSHALLPFDASRLVLGS